MFLFSSLLLCLYHELYWVCALQDLTWPAVQRKCIAGRLMPVLLFFEANSAGAPYTNVRVLSFLVIHTLLSAVRLGFALLALVSMTTACAPRQWCRNAATVVLLAQTAVVGAKSLLFMFLM